MAILEERAKGVTLKELTYRLGYSDARLKQLQKIAKAAIARREIDQKP